MLSNAYGATPLTVGSAHIALAGEGGKIQEGSDHAVTFGGSPSIVIPPGAPAVSHPVDITVARLALVSVSLYLPEITPTSTIHWDGHETAYVAAGDKVADVDFKPDSKQTQRIPERNLGGRAGERARRRRFRRLDHRRCREPSWRENIELRIRKAIECENLGEQYSQV